MSSSLGMVSYWMSQARRYPLLTPTQEISLGKQVQDWLQADNPDARTIKRGQRAREKMIKSNLRLPIAICNKFQKRIEKNNAVSMDDLLQESILGLNRAVEKFDPTSGYKFSTYAYWWLRQSVNRFVEITQTTIKISNQASQLSMRWRYRPEGMTIEEFAEKEGRSVKNCMDYIENARRADAISLDAHFTAQSDGEASSLLDLVASNDSDLEESDWTEAVQGLHQIDEIKDAMALVELSMQTKPREIAEVLDCTVPESHKRTKDAKALIREHAPSHIRERICGKEQKVSVKLEVQKPVLQTHVARELVLAGCNSNSEFMPEAISAPSTNGHHQVDTEALERLVDEVQAEPAVEASKPKRRVRRSTEEIQAERAAKAVSLTINGSTYEGSPAAIAAVVAALKAA